MLVWQDMPSGDMDNVWEPRQYGGGTDRQRSLVAIGNGLMDGKYMLLGFKNMQPQEHYVRKYYDMWNMIESDD